MTYADSHSVISLQDWACGVSRSGWLGGQMTVPSGRLHVLANLSPLQAKKMGLKTSGTYGLPSITSSLSMNLNQFLANRLQAKMALNGSTLYRLTWKRRAMPSGRQIYALRASVLRTSGSALTGWVTPSARDWKDTPGMATVRPDGRSRLDQLPRQVTLITGTRLLANGFTENGCIARTTAGDLLNPEHSRWLMGIPPAWTSCMRLATR